MTAQYREESYPISTGLTSWPPQVGFMNIVGAIIGGILGTLAMLAFFLVSPTRMGMFKLDVVSYVGLMFTARLNLARLIGLAILTFNGAVLAIISAFL